MIAHKKILSIDMGSSSYKVIEAETVPCIRILRYGVFDAGKCFRKELKKSRFAAKESFLTFHHPSVIIRELSLPIMDKQDFHDAVMTEMSDYMPFLLQDYNVGYKIIPDVNNRSMCYSMVAACPKEVAGKYTKTAMSFGLRPKVMDAQANTLLRIIKLIVRYCDELSDTAAYLVIDLGYCSTTVCIVGFGRVICCKVLDKGIKDMSDNPEQHYDSLYNVADECNRLIEYFLTSYAGVALSQGFMLGGGVFHPHIASYLKSHILINMNEINDYRQYIPCVPPDMNINLYVHSLGALFREDEENE